MTGLETAGSVASLVTSVVAVITLGVLVWYTIETHRLRWEAQRQNEHATMPIVVFQSLSSNGNVHKPIIRNLGSGPAFNIYLQGMSTADSTFDGFRHTRILSAGEDATVTIAGLLAPTQGSDGKPYQRDIKQTRGLLEYLRDAGEAGETKGRIIYDSITGQSYCTTFGMFHNSDANSFVVFDSVTSEWDDPK